MMAEINIDHQRSIHTVSKRSWSLSLVSGGEVGYILDWLQGIPIDDMGYYNIITYHRAQRNISHIYFMRQVRQAKGCTLVNVQMYM